MVFTLFTPFNFLLPTPVSTLSQIHGLLIPIAVTYS